MKRCLALVIGIVVLAGYVGVAQSAEISSVEDYDAAMKEVGATFRALRSDMEAREGEAVMAGTTKLTGLFEQVEAFWTSRNVPAAAAIASEAAEAASDIRSALEAQAFQEIAPASDALGATCQTCHNDYRERVDGDARIKAGVL